MQIHACFFLELVCQIVNQAQVEIFTTQERITVGREHFESVLAVCLGDLDNRDIESTTTEVVNRDC